MFPKPREVEEELRQKKIEDDKRAEKEELERIKSLAPAVQPPKISQLIEENILTIIFKLWKVKDIYHHWP